MEILTIIKGFIIGGSMLIPGVSGGTMAMILETVPETDYIYQLLYET